MLKPLSKDFRGLVTISGPTKSGKSELAEFLIKDQQNITYMATSRLRQNDPDWQRRITIHRRRRPNSWKLVEYPFDIVQSIKSLGKYEAILIDSLGGLVEQYLDINQEDWNSFQIQFVNCLSNYEYGIIVVSEEIGWGIVPATPLGHLFRERHSYLFSELNRYSSRKWLALNGIAIDLDNFGYKIP